MIGLAATAGGERVQEEVALKDGMTESNRDVDPDCLRLVPPRLIGDLE